MTLIIGKVRNSDIVDIDFPFHTGVAGARPLGDKRLQVAFAATIRLGSVRGEGLVDGDRYVVEGLAAQSTTAGLITMTVRQISDDDDVA